MEKKKNKGNNKAVKEIIHGRIINFDFFRKHFLLVITVLLLIIAYIAMKFTCQMHIAKIMTLTGDLNNAKTDCVKASAGYNSQIRETEMMSLIDTMHIDLASPEQPPYKLKGE
jgi:hypothetical protein